MKPEYIKGFGSAMLAFGLTTILIGIATPEHKHHQQPKFKIVDSYRNCDIVRYTDDTNRWHYFMDCKTNG